MSDVDKQMRRAWQRSQAIGRPVLLRLHHKLAACEDPWVLWWQAQHRAAQPMPFAVFHAAERQFSAAAWGAVQRLKLPPERRFAAARQICASLFEQAMDVRADGDGTVDIDAPLAFLSLALDATPPRAQWGGWGGGQLFVPQVVVYKNAAGTAAVVVQPVDGRQPQEACVAHASGAAQRTLESLRRAAVEARPPAKLCPQASPRARALQSRAQWDTQVDRARQATRGPGLQKVVLARATRCRVPPGQAFCVASTLWRLRAHHPQSITFGMAGPDNTTFVGATPEVLVEVCGRRLRTQAVAGTAPRGNDARSDESFGVALMRSAKDRHEHEVVAAALQATLGSLCLELRREAQPQLVRLPRLQHLNTPFEGQLRQAGGVLELIERLHPTPAVGGFPQQDACSFLRRHEQLERGGYAAPLGFFTAASDGLFAVALRSMLLHGSVGYGFAGAGIVAASEPAAEWRETRLKLQTMQDALCMHSASQCVLA
ncbi:MAG: isochorismate synthase [Deltaproteobacteria bacterium]|nr:MAG: isochorismate synthase [Deltaproteobacteria bacterium]